MNIKAALKALDAIEINMIYKEDLRKVIQALGAPEEGTMEFYNKENQDERTSNIIQR